MLLHDSQEADNDLARGADEDLALAGALGIADVVEAVAEDRDADHVGMLKSGLCGWAVCRDSVRMLPWAG